MPRRSQLRGACLLGIYGHATPAGDMAMHLAASYGAEQQARELQDRDVTTLVAECGDTLCAYAQLRTAGPPACVSRVPPSSCGGSTSTLAGTEQASRRR